MSRARAIPHDVVRRKPEARLAATGQHWCDGDLQAIEQVRIEEARYRRAATFDEQAQQAVFGESAHDLRQLESPVTRRHEDHLRLPVVWRAAGVIGRDQQRPGSPVAEDPGRSRQAASRVEHDADRTGPGNESRRQPRIVGGDRARADDHGVVQSAQPVQVANVLAIVDEIRVAARRCDVTVDALSQVAEDPRTGSSREAQRQIEIDERVRCPGSEILDPIGLVLQRQPFQLEQ